MWSRVCETVGGPSGVLLKMEVGIRKGAWRRAWRYPAYLWSLRWLYAVKKPRRLVYAVYPRIPPPQYTTGESVFPSACLSHSPAAAACGGFAAVGRTTSIDRCTARLQQARPPFDHQPQQHGGQQQMRAVSCSQPRQEAEHRLARTETAVKRTAWWSVSSVVCSWIELAGPRTVRQSLFTKYIHTPI